MGIRHSGQGKYESRFWASEKIPMESGEITRDEVVSIFFYSYSRYSLRQLKEELV